MARKRVKPEQIIHVLREAEVKLAGGSTMPEACRALGSSGQTYYRWRREYGGMQVSQAKKLKDLESENARLKGPYKQPKWQGAGSMMVRASGSGHNTETMSGPYGC